MPKPRARHISARRRFRKRSSITLLLLFTPSALDFTGVIGTQHPPGLGVERVDLDDVLQADPPVARFVQDLHQRQPDTLTVGVHQGGFTPQVVCLVPISFFEGELPFAHQPFEIAFADSHKDYCHQSPTNRSKSALVNWYS